MSVLFEFVHVDFRSHRKTKYAKSRIFSMIRVLVLIRQFARPNNIAGKEALEGNRGDLGISTRGR